MGLPALPGRHAGRRGVPGGRVPRRARAVRRRVHRRRRVLRAVRVPGDAGAAPGPRAAPGADRLPALLRRGGSGACSRRPRSSWSSPPWCSRRSRRRRRSPTPTGAFRAAFAVRRQLVLHRPVDRLLRRRRRRRARCCTSGRWRSRSSSTWCGRCCWPACFAVARRAGDAQLGGRPARRRRRASPPRCWRALVLSDTRPQPGLLRHRHPGLPAPGRRAARASPGAGRLGRPQRSDAAGLGSRSPPLGTLVVLGTSLLDVWPIGRGVARHRRHRAR